MILSSLALTISSVGVPALFRFSVLSQKFKAIFVIRLDRDDLPDIFDARCAVKPLKETRRLRFPSFFLVGSVLDVDFFDLGDFPAEISGFGVVRIGDSNPPFWTVSACGLRLDSELADEFDRRAVIAFVVKRLRDQPRNVLIRCFSSSESVFQTRRLSSGSSLAA